MNIGLKLAAALALATIPLGIAQAQGLEPNVSLFQTLDLTRPQSLTEPRLQGWINTPGFNGDFEVELGAGDTFAFTIDFAGNQTLTLRNLIFIWAFVLSDVESDVEATGQFQFLNEAGNPFFESAFKTSTEGRVHFGQQFGVADFGPPNETIVTDDFSVADGLPAGGNPADSITFWGVRYVAAVDGYLDTSVKSRIYRVPGLLFGVTPAGAAVPEPEAWAMLIAGFGIVGGALRRRKRVVAV